VSQIVDERVAGLAVYRHRTGPDAPRVVLVHGSMDRAATFGKVIRRLPELAIVRYDRRGYGRSHALEVASDLQEQVEDLLLVLDGEPAVVVGHSLGGVIALAAAQREPALVPSVAAFESPMSWLDWWPTRSAGGEAMAAVRGDAAERVSDEEAAERFMRRMIGEDRWEGLSARTRQARRAEGPALLAELASIRSEAPYDPGSLQVPVLAGHGTASQPYHQQAAARLAEWAPRGELLVIDGAGHAAQASHPEAFAAFVRRAVARAAPPSPGLD
jgi:pimeloyl-ACP methyl ester carboxylesterase